MINKLPYVYENDYVKFTEDLGSDELKLRIKTSKIEISVIVIVLVLLGIVSELFLRVDRNNYTGKGDPIIGTSVRTYFSDTFTINKVFMYMH